ncbi:MAG: ATP-binding protein [Desulfovibrionaceae bacterium]
MLVACLGGIFSAGVYVWQARIMRADMVDKAEETAQRIADILSVPMWNVDERSIRALGDVYIQNEHLAYLRITETDGLVMYDFNRGTDPDPAIRRSQGVRHGDGVIGKVDLAFSMRGHQNQLWQIAAVLVGSMLGVLVMLTTVTGMLLRVLLRRPLQVFRAGMDSVARGDFNGEGDLAMGYAELSDIAQRFMEMAAQVKAREQSLHEMNANLRAAEEKYRSIFENAVEGMYQTTPDGRILGANPTMARVLGYDSVESCMRQIDNARKLFVNPEQRDEYVRLLREHGEVSQYIIPMRRRDGGIMWASCNARAIFGPDGEFLHIDGMLENVTERKKAEDEVVQLTRNLERLVEERTSELSAKARELEEANRQLRALDALKSGFLSCVSHELRTPLTSIMGFAKIALRDFRRHMLPVLQDKGDARRYGQMQKNLGIIAYEGERLTRLINDVLDLNKIESGRMEWRDALIDPAAVIYDAVLAVSAQFTEKGSVELRTEILEKLPPVFMDRDKLEQVMINLLHNAAKFTTHGKVVVRATCASPEVLRVEVQDTGEGIASGMIENIFEMFHQSMGDTLSGQPKGTGLGLAICRQIISHYGGSIWAESILGSGSTFVFTLPVAEGRSLRCRE